jgi:CDP-diacylglycerol--glycerol-3-phosphate 3-phosphatidyltransferase
MATPPVERSPRGRGSGPRDYQTEFRNRLIQSRLTPNAISLTGFALCLVSAAFVLQGWWIAGGIAFIVGSVCDTLDGRYSRMSGKGTPFGAFLDSTLDRIEEGVVLAAVAVRIVKEGSDLTVIAGADVAAGVVVLAILASLMVSYTRARAEALGVECKVGIADRPVRVVVLSAGLCFGDLQAIEPAVYVLAAMAVITVFQRIFHVRSELKKPVTGTL